MNYFSKQSGKNKKNSNILFWVLVLIFSSIGTSFGQTTVENNSNATMTITTSETMVVKPEVAETTNPNMNFVLWFMGSKQDPNAKVSNEGINTKKQFMISGSEPNRLLIKAFLKKAVNFESGIV